MFPFPTYSPGGLKLFEFLGGAFDPTNLTTRTYADMNLGETSPNRYIVAGVSNGHTTTPRRVTGVSIAGIAMTSVANPGATNLSAASLWIAAVPAGRTGNLVVTADAGSNLSSVGLWALRGIASPTPFHSLFVNSGAVSPMALAVNTPAPRSVVLAIASNIASPGVSWAGLTGDAEQSNSRDGCVGFASGIVTGQQTPLALSAIFAGSLGGTRGAAASWSF